MKLEVGKQLAAIIANLVEGKHSNPKWRNEHHGGNDRLPTEENIGEVRRKYAARAPVWSPRTSVCPPFYTQLELEAVPKTIYDWLTVELNSSCVEDSIKSFWPLCFCLAGSHLESIKRSLFWLACNPTYSHEAVLGDSYHYFTTAKL